MPTRTLPLAALAFAWLTTLPAAADTTFKIFRNCGPDAGATSSSPLIMSASCESIYGTGTNFGLAGYGSVGVAASAVHAAQNSVQTGSGIRATFTTDVFFSSSDPSILVVTPVLNLKYSGSIYGVSGTKDGLFGTWQGASEATGYFGGYFGLGHTFGSDADLHDTFFNGLHANLGTLGAATANLLLQRTPVGPVALNAPVTLELSAAVSAGASELPGSYAVADASHTFEIPFGVDVFDLPPGVTANSGDWLVNNRRVDLSAPPVPEPEAYALMALGLGMVLITARRRRPAR